MKKILVVLTILVLVAGSAFAALSGSVEAKYDFDFDKPAVKYSVGGANAKLAFTLTTEAIGVTGETKPYAVVTAGLELGGAVGKNAIKTLAWDADDEVYTVSVSGAPTWAFTLKEFKIVGENWELNFIKAIGVGNYAVSAWEIDDTDDENALTAPWAFKTQPGVTFTYDGFSVGIAGSAVAATKASVDGWSLVFVSRSEAAVTDFAPYVVYYGLADIPEALADMDAVTRVAIGKEIEDLMEATDCEIDELFGFVEVLPDYYDVKSFTGHETVPAEEGYYLRRVEAGATPAGAATSNLNLRAESKELVFGDNVTAKFAAAAGISKADAHADITFDFGVSAKVAYAADAVSVSFAADVQKLSAKEKADFDAALKVAVAPVTVDAFYATILEYPARYSLIDDETGYLSVRAIVDLSAITSVDMKVYLYGENLLNIDRLLGIEEKATFGKLTEDAQFGIYPGLFEKSSIWFANAEVGYDVAENLNVYAGAGVLDFVGTDAYVLFSAAKVGAKYTHDVFTADGAFYVSKVFGAVEEKLLPGFKATVSSDKLVEKAVLSATLLINQNKVVEAYDATRALDDYTLNGVDTSDWTFNGRNALTLSCKVAF